MPTYPNGSVFDYGNVLRNVNEMHNRNALTQNRLDPNSLDNRYRQAQIDRYRYETDNPGAAVDPTSPMRNYDKLQQLIANGASPEQIATFKNFVRAQQIRNVGGVDTIIGAGGADNTPLSTLENELDAASRLSGTKGFSGQAGEQAARAGLPDPYAPVSQTELTLPPVQAPPTEASLAGEKAKETEQAKLDVEESSRKEIKKQSMREADAINAKTLIDDMLAPRGDGKGIYATYAYGRGNVITPDVLKPQEWIDAEAKRNQLVSMMQLENVAKLKGTGPITEPEQKVLRQAMTVLENPLISPELVEKELKRVRIMFAKWDREAKAMQGKEPQGETYEQRKARILAQ